jgi:zinc/manganese transport system ATP-binding protein
MTGCVGGGIEIDDVSVSYGPVVALDRVSGCFPAGSLTALVGPNGAGKSTLLKTVAGLIRPDQGRVLLPDAGTREIAYLPQRAEIERRFPLSTADLVLLGLWRRIGAFGRAGRREQAEIERALASVGLAGLGRRPIGALSIGQFQRALFARILVQDAPVILLDEPLAAVDAETAETLLSMLPGWQAEGRTVVAALHDADQVRRYFPLTLRLDRRVVAWGPTAPLSGPAAVPAPAPAPARTPTRA